MNTLTSATATVGALTALALGTQAGAHAAPSGIGSAQDVVDALESSGYAVIVHHVGVRPLNQCTVDSVRPGGTVTHPISAGDRVREVVYLTARC
jgi:hypothetical protein